MSPPNPIPHHVPTVSGHAGLKASPAGSIHNPSPDTMATQWSSVSSVSQGLGWHLCGILVAAQLYAGLVLSESPTGDS